MDQEEFLASVQTQYHEMVRAGVMGTILFTDAEYDKLIEAFMEQAFLDGRDVQSSDFCDEVLAFVRMAERCRLFDTTVNIILKGVARPRLCGESFPVQTLGMELAV